ncbi:MAG: carboxypeptidase regulatory-like domain-containing protein [Pyrinomonadaceae bacterium]
MPRITRNAFIVFATVLVAVVIAASTLAFNGIIVDPTSILVAISADRSELEKQNTVEPASEPLRPVAPLLPDVFSQAAKYTAPDGSANDEFGFSVAISRDYVIVGASRDDENRGAAYIFQRTGSTAVFVIRLVASDRAIDDSFGWSVAINGTSAFIGAYSDDESGIDQGSVYVFTRNGAAWTQTQKLLAPDGAAGDGFGTSIAVDGADFFDMNETVVIGAPGDDNFRGSANVFIRSGAAWSLQQKLTAADGATSDEFGWSVGFYTDTAVIGAYRDDNSRGAAYVFRRTNTAWSQEQKLIASDGGAFDQFGYSVDIHGDRAVVGAVLDDPAGVIRGSAYSFGRNGTTWTQQQKLTASDGSTGDKFGSAVSLAGSRLAIGANGDDAGTVVDRGAVYYFVGAAGTFTEQQKLAASDGAAGDNLGTSLALSGENLIVGAYLDDGAAVDQGAAYFFTDSGSTPTPTATPTASPTPAATPTPTASPTATPTPTASPITSPTPTGSPTPTPSSDATVSGIVTTPDGRGLRNATVVITDAAGMSRSVTTSSFGFYSFADVPTGASYTIRVISRRYRFAAQQVTVNGNIDVNFVGLE